MDDQQLREKGLKVTAPRLKILKILADQTNIPRHMSAEDIYKTLTDTGEDIVLSTVYRVLDQFEQKNLVIRQNFEGGTAVFELNRGTPHDHLVCVKCGYVVEFSDETIKTQQMHVSKHHKFNAVGYNLTIYGICQSCHSEADH